MWLLGVKNDVTKSIYLWLYISLIIPGLQNSRHSTMRWKRHWFLPHDYLDFCGLDMVTLTFVLPLYWPFGRKRCAMARMLLSIVRLTIADMIWPYTERNLLRVNAAEEQDSRDDALRSIHSRNRMWGISRSHYCGHHLDFFSIPPADRLD